MGLYSPYPFHRHLCPGDGLDAFPNLGLAQLVSAVPSRVMSATHVANLVNSALEGRNSATDECAQEIIGRHSLPLERDDKLVNRVDLEVGVTRVEIPIVLLCGGAESKCRQVQEIVVLRALHVEERPLPFPA